MFIFVSNEGQSEKNLILNVGMDSDVDIGTLLISE
jgi:hypothetical protein